MSDGLDLPESDEMDALQSEGAADRLVRTVMEAISVCCQETLERVDGECLFHAGWLSSIQAIADHAVKVISEVEQLSSK